MDELRAVRTVSKEPVPETKWRPVDLLCRDDASGTERIVRTKLQCSPESAAMCFAEAASHGALKHLGVRVAEPVVVLIDQELADGITAAFEFDPSVLAGRHWGTVFIDDSHGPDSKSIRVEELEDPSEILRIYLADVVLGNADRLTAGNVLLVPGRRNKFGVVAIDQSEAFGTHGCLRRAGCLAANIDRLSAHPLPQAEVVAVDLGRGVVEQMFMAMVAAADDLRAVVNQVPAEWIDRGGVDADGVQVYLEHRARNLTAIAGMEGWLERCDLVSGSPNLALDFGDGS